jgi:hypothetical protein
MAAINHPPGLPALMLAIAAGCVASACARDAPLARDVSIAPAWSPSPPVVGTARLTLRVLDAARTPVTGAQLKVESHMSHPGMPPLLTTPVERAPGVYDTDVQFTMRGDWILVVSGQLADGSRVHQRIDVRDVR